MKPFTGVPPMEKQYDMQGNSFMPRKGQEALVRAGWKLHSRKKRGMIKIVWWVDPTDGTVMAQGQAVITQKNRNAIKD